MSEEFKDHIVQHPRRFRQTTVAPGVVELTPTWEENPNEVVQLGTPIDRQLFNGITSQLAEKTQQMVYYVKNESQFLTRVQQIKDAIKVLRTTKVKIVFEAGTYSFDQTIVIPPYMRIGVNGVVIINYTGSGALFHVKYTDTLTEVNAYTTGFWQNPLHNGNVLDGSDGSLILKGSGSANPQIALRFGDETLTEATHRKHVAWTQFVNVFIESFGTAFSFTQRETYIMTFENVTATNCGVIIKDELPTINAGEQIRWNNCNFHNSTMFLELGSEINHVFNACSIDYNVAGVSIKNNRYATIRFIGCWIEASNTTGIHPFINSVNTNVNTVIVIMDGCYIYPRNKIADTLFKGKFKLVWSDNFVFVNRFSATSQNIGAGAVLCDDEVLVTSVKGTTFQEQKMVISRYQALNRNSGFETDAVGATTVTGFSRTNNAGEAGFVVDDTRAFSGTKSLKVNTEGATKTYTNVITEKVPLRNAEQVYGQARIFFNEAKTYGITVVITFYADDKTTVIDTVSNPQNITTSSVGQWKALMTGTFYDKPIPPRAMYADMKVTIGSLSSDCWVDDVILSYL